MKPVIYNTDSSIFTFGFNDVTERLRSNVSEHKVDEAIELLRYLLNPLFIGAGGGSRTRKWINLGGF